MSALLARFSGFDGATGMLSLPWWMAGAAAALLVGFVLLAFSRAGQDGVVGAFARLALVAIGAGATFVLLDGTSRRDLAAERRALDTRAFELLARAAVPGSPLACLDGTAGETVEQSCEKALFAAPETTAAAVSYVAAQLTLLADYTQLVRRSGGSEPSPLVNLRRAAETDRFGLVAQVLSVRDGCTSSECEVLALFKDPAKITDNLVERTYDFYVVRYSGNWPAITKPPVAGLPPAGTPTAGTPTATAGRSPGELFFPSSASIPPVNIMDSEPSAPPPPASQGHAAPAAKQATKQPPTPPRRPAQAPAQARPPVDLNAAARSTPPPPADTQ